MKASPSLFSKRAAFYAAAPWPFHVRIERELRHLRKLPKFQYGSLLPDELNLADRFGFSRGTIRIPLARLVEQHLPTRKRSIGARVLPTLAAELKRKVE